MRLVPEANARCLRRLMNMDFAQNSKNRVFLWISQIEYPLP